MVILKRYIFLISTFVSGLLVVYFFSDRQNFSPGFDLLGRIVHGISLPLDVSVTWVKQAIVSTVHNYIVTQDVHKKNDNLQVENMQLKAQILQLHDVQQENTQLRQYLDLMKHDASHYVVASVIGFDALFNYKSIRINKGSKQGIAVGMGVMTTEGVVGVVMRVWRSSADVLLLTDPNSNLDVFVLRNLRRGVLQGGIGHVMQFKYFDRGTMLLIGDDVVTSGLTGAFPSNVAVGKIVRILPEEANGVGQTVDVEPVVDLNHLTNVLVLQ